MQTDVQVIGHRPTRRWIAFIAGVLAVPTVLGGVADATPVTPAPPAAASTRWAGQAALDRLGDRLPAVARSHGLTEAALRHHLATDASLRVDSTDRLLYVDSAPTAAQLAAATGTSPFDPSTPPADAFTLHSNPGADRVVYLDFDGHTLAGTAWNGNTGGTCFAEPFDADGTPASFSDAERNTVIDVWRRIAEDYAPFAVDITTADPGDAALARSSSSDLQYGTRLIITNSTQPCPNGKTLYSSVCGGGCGGIAYVGIFSSTSNTYYQPAIVFQNGVGTGGKYIAEAGSHEIGHNVGLSHDGQGSTGYYSGQGSWAPIMGVGYYKAISQWSKGEYTNANQTQDDFAVMGNNGLPLRSDDHGDTTATATALSGNPAVADGIISTRTDVDAFTVTAPAGLATFAVAPTPTSPNLDVRLELLAPDGTSLAVDDPASGSTNGDVATGMGASISADLAGGTYTLLVDGVGSGDVLATGYTDYASLGYFRLTATVTGPEGRAPSAAATATPTSGTAPLLVSLDGSASTDPEGGTLTYLWDFGDATATSASAVTTHTYSNPGTYTATLTVTDDMSLTSTTKVVVTVAAPVPRIDVAAMSVTGTRNPSTSKSNVSGSVTVRNQFDAAISGVSVTASWYVGTKLTTTRSVTTATSGVSTFSLTNQRLARGTVVKLCVTRLSRSGMTWDQTLYAPTSGTQCSTWTVP